MCYYWKSNRFFWWMLLASIMLLLGSSEDLPVMKRHTWRPVRWEMTHFIYNYYNHFGKPKQDVIHSSPEGNRQGSSTSLVDRWNARGLSPCRALNPKHESYWSNELKHCTCLILSYLVLSCLCTPAALSLAKAWSSLQLTEVMTQSSMN